MNWPWILNSLAGLGLVGYFIWRIWQGYKQLQITFNPKDRSAIVGMMAMRAILATMILGIIILTFPAVML